MADNLIDKLLEKLRRWTFIVKELKRAFPKKSQKNVSLSLTTRTTNMNFPKRVPESDEAELRVMTLNMYNNGGVANVLDCIMTMRETEIIILKKLNEILEEEKKRRSA